jgi:hypothetical protein
VGDTKHKVKKVWSERDLILLKPKNGLDSDSVAKELAACSGVEAVHMTSGKYGFLIFARGSNGSVGKVISRISGEDADVLANHYVYKMKKW